MSQQLAVLCDRHEQTEAGTKVPGTTYRVTLGLNGETSIHEVDLCDRCYAETLAAVTTYGRPVPKRVRNRTPAE